MCSSFNLTFDFGLSLNSASAKLKSTSSGWVGRVFNGARLAEPRNTAGASVTSAGQGFPVVTVSSYSFVSAVLSLNILFVWLFMDCQATHRTFGSRVVRVKFSVLRFNRCFRCFMVSLLLLVLSGNVFDFGHKAFEAADNQPQLSITVASEARHLSFQYVLFQLLIIWINASRSAERSAYNPFRL